MMFWRTAFFPPLRLVQKKQAPEAVPPAQSRPRQRSPARSTARCNRVAHGFAMMMRTTVTITGAAQRVPPIGGRTPRTIPLPEGTPTNKDSATIGNPINSTATKPRGPAICEVPSRFSRARNGLVEAADDALPAERHHRVEERRGDGLTHNGDAGCVDQQRGFHASCFGDAARG